MSCLLQQTLDLADDVQTWELALKSPLSPVPRRCQVGRPAQIVRPRSTSIPHALPFPWIGKAAPALQPLVLRLALALGGVPAMGPKRGQARPCSLGSGLDITFRA